VNWWRTAGDVWLVPKPRLLPMPCRPAIEFVRTPRSRTRPIIKVQYIDGVFQVRLDPARVVKHRPS